MQKKTWKVRGMKAEIERAMATAGSVAAAARQLGINRSTLHRLVQAGKIPPLTRRRLRAVPMGSVAEPGPQSPAAWAETIRQTYALTATEAVLLGCAVDALSMSQATTLKPADRLAASGRFARLIQQLNFEAPEHGETQSTPHSSNRWAGVLDAPKRKTSFR